MSRSPIPFLEFHLHSSRVGEGGGFSGVVFEEDLALHTPRKDLRVNYAGGNKRASRMLLQGHTRTPILVALLGKRFASLTQLHICPKPDLDICSTAPVGTISRWYNPGFQRSSLCGRNPTEFSSHKDVEKPQIHVMIASVVLGP